MAWSDVVLQLSCDSDLSDRSLSGHTVTQVGTVAISGATPKFGAGACDLNAAAPTSPIGRVFISSSADFNPGATGLLTMAGFFYLTSISGAYNNPAFFALRSDSNNTVSLSMTAAGVFNCTSRVAGVLTTRSSAAQVVALNTWHFVALVLDAGNVYCYLNANRIVNSTLSVPNLSMDAAIGSSATTPGTNFMAGYFDEVKFERQALYTGATLTVPTQPFTTFGNATMLSPGTTFGTGSARLSLPATMLSPATTFGTGSARLVQPATGFLSENFGTPGNVLTQPATGFLAGDFGTGSVLLTQLATMLDPGTAFGSPLAVFLQVGEATGWTETTFGTPVQAGIQDSTGFTETTFGTPAIIPAAVGWSETTFGTASILFTEQGWSETTFGTPGSQVIHRAASIGLTTLLGTPTTPTNREFEAEGFLTGNQDAAHVALVRTDGSTWNTLTQARWIDARADFGEPTAVASIACVASALDPATTFGGASAFDSPYCLAEPIEPGSFGEPGLLLTQGADGWRETVFGTAVARLILSASSIEPTVRFGDAIQFGENTAYGWSSTGFGQPTGFVRFNYPAEGWTETAFGEHLALQGHRASALPPATEFGTPLLLRNTPC